VLSILTFNSVVGLLSAQRQFLLASSHAAMDRLTTYSLTTNSSIPCDHDSTGAGDAVIGWLLLVGIGISFSSQWFELCRQRSSHTLSVVNLFLANINNVNVGTLASTHGFVMFAEATCCLRQASTNFFSLSSAASSAGSSCILRAPPFLTCARVRAAIWLGELQFASTRRWVTPHSQLVLHASGSRCRLLCTGFLQQIVTVGCHTPVFVLYLIFMTDQTPKPTQKRAKMFFGIYCFVSFAYVVICTASGQLSASAHALYSLSVCLQL
jgi:hypothetical protein